MSSDNPIFDEFDSQGLRICESLCRTFDLTSPGHFARGATESRNVSIGIEVEVPWSSYFPELWEKFGLKSRRIAQLTTAELLALNDDCAEIEKTLQPRLQATVDCGIPRGNDRYWEFAHPPVTNSMILVDQVALLTQAGLVPRNREHALHVTVGGIPRCASMYHLSMVLELEFVSASRISKGIEQMSQTIHTGWGRKGSAGIFEKSGTDLVGGANLASELRLLQLPKTDERFASLMSAVQWGVNAIEAKRAGRPSADAEAWDQFDSKVPEILEDFGLKDRNWFTGGPDGKIDTSSWQTFCARMPEIRAQVRNELPGDLLERLGVPSKKVLAHNP